MHRALHYHHYQEAEHQGGLRKQEAALNTIILFQVPEDILCYCIVLPPLHSNPFMETQGLEVDATGQ